MHRGMGRVASMRLKLAFRPSLRAQLMAGALCMTQLVVLLWLAPPSRPAPVRTLRIQTSPHLGVCANTVQGATLLADDRGYVCARTAVDPTTGCCTLDDPHARPQYTCVGCDSGTQCCDVYEVCVACCMQPSNEDMLSRIKIASDNVDLDKTIDQFDLCRMLCRTNSMSVVDENRYKSPLRHCFSGRGPPIADLFASGVTSSQSRPASSSPSSQPASASSSPTLPSSASASASSSSSSSASSSSS